MGHFRVPKTLTFKTRLSANLCCENEFYLNEHKKSFSDLSLALKQRLEATRKRPIILTTADTKFTRNPWIVTQESSGKSLRTGTRYCMQPFQCATNNIKLIRFINRMTERVTFRTCEYVKIIRKTNQCQNRSAWSWPELICKCTWKRKTV